MIPDRTIQSRLLESFEMHRDDIAIECENNTITYHNLHQHSNYIANWLMALGLKKETFIGIMVDNKITLVTVILGIIKAGCVFVPLDSRYPDKRTEAMLLSSETPYVFTEEDKIERLKTIRRHLPHPIDILTINEKFYLSNRTLKLKRYDDAYKLSEAESTRYKRQILLDGWGIQGQERLKASTVFVAGAGGSGSPLIQQLALCGFGTIIICDYDTVELSNLNRQSLHDETRIGMNKALSAKKTVERMNPHINVIARQEKITLDNVFELVGDAEIIFDNVDSLEAKSYLSQCAVARGIPHIISSMIHINAYVCIFHTPHTPCFHCLYDKKKIDDITKAKTQTSFYEVIPNSVASPALHLSTGFAVNEAVKILLGFGKPAYNKYIHFNQYGSPDVVFTNGYKQITYPFNDHFREISRKQGFDWDTGWHGNFVEEIAIEPDPNCSFCRKSNTLMAKKDNPGHETHGEEPLHSLYYETLPEVDYLPEDKINIYFTSGTTGQPKAVLGKNEGLTHFIAWEIKELNIDETKRVSQLTSQCHDPFLRDIFVPLCAGGTICVPDSIETLLDSQRMMNWMESSRVNLVHCTPSLFKVIDSDRLNPGSYAHLEYVLLAGEKVVPQDLENWYRVLGDRVQLVNIYGPTETTLAKLFYFINPKDLERDTIPIGKPIPGAKVIILDKALNICGPGEVGEIYIRTPFRSYGYYNDSKLTAEKFIQNPFSNNPDDIIYKTGDLGKINREGVVEFIGREDRQVKIRGFRVELDEVEKRIRDYPGVQEAVVLNRRTSTGNFILCAYFKGEIAVMELKEHLTQELPDYMVPSFYITMEKLPLTTNGKINYKVLPEPDEVERKEYAAPKNELEKQVVQIWTEILGIKKIGMNDGFLDMGGNSLNAMNLISRIYKAFDVNLQLSVIFENPTVEELVSVIEASGKSIYQSIKPIEKRSYYPLSSAQLRMYLLKAFAGEEDISYNQSKPLFIKGRLDKERLEDAFKRLLARHDALRTGFETINGQPVQRIHKKAEFNIKDYIPVGTGKQGGLAPLEVQVQGPGEGGEPGSLSVANIIKDFVKAFDFSQPPLVRVGLVKTAEEEHLLVFDIHHIISDGVTTGIFIEEFMKLYTGQPLQELGLQYKDYAVWQQQMLLSGPLKKQETYWLEVFKEEPPVLNLATDYPRPGIQSFEGAKYHFDVDPRLIEKLEVLARKRNATLYMVLLAAYTTLLYRYTGQEDIVVGSPIAGRPHEELQHIPGVFINTLAMRNFPEGGKTFDQLVDETAENSFRAYANQDYPFEELVGKLDPGRNLDRNPLFDTLFIMQNIDQKSICIEGLTVSPCPFEPGVSRFDITLIALETGKGIDFSLEYSTRLFRPDTIKQFTRHLVTLLESVVTNPSQTLGQIDMLSSGEKEQLIQRFNNTHSDYPGDKTIHQCFQEQAQRTPDSIALNMSRRTHTTHLTYHQLNRQSNQLAHLLIEKGVGADSIVGILVERSVEMIIGIIGILKSGGIYLPIDPEFPENRIKYMLSDSGAEIVLTSSDYFPGGAGVLAPLYLSETLYAPCAMPHASQTGSSSLAYIIYTSGSTGKPKGVAIEHKQVMNFFFAMKAEIEFLPGKTILALTTISFDIFLLETLLPLTSGLRVVVAGGEHQKDQERLRELILDNHIDMLQVTPSRLKLFLHDSRDMECLRVLTELIIGGEALPNDLYRECLSRCSGHPVRVYNVYGPTETTVWSTLKHLKDVSQLTIGTPVKNTSIYIMDKENNWVPQGAGGELCIGGEGVARGYLNQPELTTEKFNKDFQLSSLPLYPSTPLYRTGDLARWLPDGDIEFLGRIDHQVKIRGFRIETGEIESRLSDHKKIKEAVVTASGKEGDKYLCAYIVPQDPGAIKKDTSIFTELREYLSAALPDYMIPSYFVWLEEIPLTPNGKIDRKALPAPEVESGKAYAPPRNEGEEKLVEIWSDLLGVDAPIGIDDSFFELGGHSLKAILMVSEIHKTFDVKVSLPEMFKRPFIRGLYQYIKTAKKETYQAIKPVEKKDFYKLSFNQKRLWIIHRLKRESTSYNMTQRIELLHKVDPGTIEKSLFRLMQRHESLRTGFKEVDDEPVQLIVESVEVPFRIIDISSLPGEEKEQERERIFEEEARTPFDPEQAPLFRTLLIRLNHSHFDLVFNIHHIICDAWSMEILQKDFYTIYESNRRGEPVELEPLALQYKDFAGWHNRQISNPFIKEKSHRFWLEKLKGGLPVLEFPMALSQNRDDPTAAAYRCMVGEEVNERLKRLAEENDTTLSMVMFSIYNILLSLLSGQQEIICALIGGGREHASLYNTVGYFINSIMVKTHVDAEEGFNDFLHKFGTDVMEIVQHQGYPLELVLDDLKMSYPRISAAYNMLNIQESKKEEVGEPFEPGFYTDVKDVKFDMELYISEYRNSIEMFWIFRKAMFGKEAIEYLTTTYSDLLKELSEEE